MGDRPEETINKDDILFYKIHKAVAEWCDVEPTEYQKYINQLLPVEKEDRIMSALRPIDIELQCLLHASLQWMGKHEATIDTYTGSALGVLIHGMKTCSFVNASRERKMVDGESCFWAIRRKANQAWFIEVPASDVDKVKEKIRSMFE
jgi:hypothetical protein